MGDRAPPHLVATHQTFEDPAWLATMELATLCSVPMALKAALSLDVFEILAKHGAESQLSAKEFVARIPTLNPSAPASLDRILRVLACHSILTSSAQLDDSGRTVRKYGLTPMCKYLVKDALGFSLAPILLMNQDKVFMDTWHHVHEAVLDGAEPFTRAHGKNAFEYGLEDVRFDKLFNGAMANHTTLLIKGLLEIYNGFNDIRSLVDVGGGTGACLNIIVTKHPGIRGINFDQPHVVEAAPSYPGVEHVGGDMFESVPSGEAIFMKWILHDWSDEHCIKLLKNCYQALPAEGGKVIAVDAVLAAKVRTGLSERVASHHNLMMLAYNPGGKERTEAEFKDLAMAAGFTDCKHICTFNETSVTEFYK